MKKYLKIFIYVLNVLAHVITDILFVYGIIKIFGLLSKG